MELIITLNGVTRNFQVDEGDIYNNDWTAVLADMLDTIEASQDPLK